MPLNLALPPSTLQQMNQSAPEQAPARSTAQWPQWAAAFGNAGDLITTQLAMAKGAHEANPLLPKGQVANGVMQGLEDVMTQYLIHALGPHHPLVAKILGGATGAIGAYSTLRNIQTMRAQDARMGQ